MEVHDPPNHICYVRSALAARGDRVSGLSRSFFHDRLTALYYVLHNIVQ